MIYMQINPDFRSRLNNLLLNNPLLSKIKKTSTEEKQPKTDPSEIDLSEKEKKLGEQTSIQDIAKRKEQQLQVGVSAKKLIIEAKKFRSFITKQEQKEPEKGELKSFVSMLNTLDVSELKQISNDELKDSLLDAKKELEKYISAIFASRESKPIETDSESTPTQATVIAVNLAESMNFIAGDPVWDVAAGLQTADDLSKIQKFSGTTTVFNDVASSVGLVVTMADGVRLAVKKNAIRRNRIVLKKLKNECEDAEKGGVAEWELKNKIIRLEKKIKPNFKGQQSVLPRVYQERKINTLNLA